jgi:hypothetical protein
MAGYITVAREVGLYEDALGASGAKAGEGGLRCLLTPIVVHGDLRALRSELQRDPATNAS